MKLLKLIEIADLIANSIDFESVTAGCIDTSATQTIGVYQRDETEIRECIGGESSYQTAKVRILIHWTTNPNTAEEKAAEIAEIFSGLRDMPTAEHIIKFANSIKIRSIGKDEKGICEYIVDADIIYIERND